MFHNDQPIFEFRGPWGVPIQFGASIILLFLVFVSFSSGPVVLYYDLIFVALVVLSIFLHELGHAWGALIQGVPVRRIMIHGGGGFCERSRSASRYQDELIVAMGPIVNLALWAILSLIEPFLPAGDLAWAVGTMAWLNLYLALFNLVPVWPLDGGRLFQLLMLRFLPSDIAMRVSGAVGLLIAILWIPLMIMSFLFMGMVLFFIPPFRAQWEMLRRTA
jgi:Zn-dependent protease